MSFCVQGLKLLKQPKNKILFHRHKPHWHLDNFQAMVFMFGIQTVDPSIRLILYWTAHYLLDLPEGYLGNITNPVVSELVNSWLHANEVILRMQFFGIFMHCYEQLSMMSTKQDSTAHMTNMNNIT